MSRKKSGLYNDKSYQNEYHKKMKHKLISFNPVNQDDMILYDYMMSQKNVTGYIKRLIREDMDHYKMLEKAERRGIEALKKSSITTFPAQDGYRDEEAIKECTEKEHTVCVHRQDNWEVRIDVDAKKVLTVKDISGISVPGCKMIL